ncbi:hypothetical protein VTJ83DRAFT_5563 [Remersonia thermophila]|uniref:Phospholipid/glycerol acyltransferase domain-containing protein n=1 Tax=Remersonia thermophila TaxID=72144 RepID=A0ABR4D8M8_9PEZI
MPKDASGPAPTGAASSAKQMGQINPWKYDTFLWTMSVLVDLFFREVHPRGAWKVPRHGPVLFVAAPHANQFVDALVLQRVLRMEAKRRVSLLIAQKSVHGFIGWASRQVGCVPVGRAQDAAKPAQGTIYLPDPVNDPTLVRGVGTDFEKEAQVGGMVFLPSAKGRSGASVDVAAILGPTELRVKRPFTGKLAMEQLTARDDIDDSGNLTNPEANGPKPGYEGTKFKLAPYIDQSRVYDAVFSCLKSGGCIGIFPEGGSHDRTELLPLKAGVAIMALGTLAEAPDCGLRIVPVGMNYFHAHKFRSRAVIEFGPPFEVPPKLVEMYKNNQRRHAIGQLLDMVHSALSAVTVSTPDYDTLMVIQAARRLYNPTGKKLPLPIVVELNRRLARGYEKYKNDPRIGNLRESVTEYNKQLRYLNIRDHQVEYASLSWPVVFVTFVYRVLKLTVLSAGVLPGLVLFAPIFIATRYISHQKAKTALAASSVKIQGKDVIATWKMLVSLALAPVLYNFYTCILAYMVYQNRLWGHVPGWVPLWAVFLAGWVIFPAITFAALRFGEVGMDIVKSLRPLALCISPTSSYGISRLRERRAELAAQVAEAVNTIGPEMYPDFEHTRLIFDAYARGVSTDVSNAFLPNGGHSPGSPRPGSAHSGASSPGGSFSSNTPGSPGLVRRLTTTSSRAIPRNESFSNIGGAPLFATRPPSRSRSRSSSVGTGLAGGSGPMAGFPVSAFTTLDSKESFEHANRKIREAMRERGELRRREKRRQSLAQVQDEDDESSSDGESGSVVSIKFGGAGSGDAGEGKKAR